MPAPPCITHEDEAMAQNHCLAVSTLYLTLCTCLMPMGKITRTPRPRIHLVVIDASYVPLSLSKDLRLTLFLYPPPPHSPMFQLKACSAPENRAMSEATEHVAMSLTQRRWCSFGTCQNSGPKQGSHALLDLQLIKVCEPLLCAGSWTMLDNGRLAGCAARSH